jgi:hypothetical protein
MGSPVEKSDRDGEKLKRQCCAEPKLTHFDCGCLFGVLASTPIQPNDVMSDR